MPMRTPGLCSESIAQYCFRFSAFKVCHGEAKKQVQTRARYTWHMLWHLVCLHFETQTVTRWCTSLDWKIQDFRSCAAPLLGLEGWCQSERPNRPNTWVTWKHHQKQWKRNEKQISFPALPYPSNYFYSLAHCMSPPQFIPICGILHGPSCPLHQAAGLGTRISLM